MISSVTSGSTIDLAALARARFDNPSTEGTGETSGSGHAHRMHGGPPPGPPPEAIDAAAEALDMSTEDVQKALQSGTTLADLADSKGVSQDDLLKAVTDGLAAGATKHGRQLTSDQLTDFASRIISGDGPPAPPAGAGAAGGAESDRTLSSLRDLLASVGSGTSSSTTATANAQRAYAMCSGLLGTDS